MDNKNLLSCLICCCSIPYFLARWYIIVLSCFIKLWFDLTGCLPTLATIPVFIGLYQALSNVANEVINWLIKNQYQIISFIKMDRQSNLVLLICQTYLFFSKGLLTEGFFWIPSLGGPTTIAARQSGSGISWLIPFVVIEMLCSSNLFSFIALSYVQRFSCFKLSLIVPTFLMVNYSCQTPHIGPILMLPLI